MYEKNNVWFFGYRIENVGNGDGWKSYIFVETILLAVDSSLQGWYVPRRAT